MTLRLLLKDSKRITLISVYAPTMMYSSNDREALYQSLADLVCAVQKEDKLMLLGDFNVRVVCDLQSWTCALDPHGVGKENSHGQLLLTFCAEHALAITNTLFQKRRSRESTPAPSTGT